MCVAWLWACYVDAGAKGHLKVAFAASKCCIPALPPASNKNMCASKQQHLSSLLTGKSMHFDQKQSQFLLLRVLQAQRDLDKALTCLMLAQGFVAGGDGQHFKYKVKQATSKAVTARHKRSKSAEGGSLQSSSLPQAAPAGSLPPVPPPSPPSKPPLASAVRSASAWSAPALELNSSTVSAAVMARVPKSTGR